MLARERGSDAAGRIEQTTVDMASGKKPTGCARLIKLHTSTGLSTQDFFIAYQIHLIRAERTFKVENLPGKLLDFLLVSESSQIDQPIYECFTESSTQTR
jgi:hypothetical protein